MDGSSVIQIADSDKRAGRPAWQRPGYKIHNSLHAMPVAKILLTKNSVADAVRYLADAGMSCDYDTVAAYRDNYLPDLEQSVRDGMLSEFRREREDQEIMFVAAAIHANLSRAESLIQLIEETETQLGLLKAKERPTAGEQSLIGEHIDRIERLRKELEDARKTSEVECERSKAVMAVAKRALKYLKGRDAEAHQFISEVAAINGRRELPVH